MSSADKNLSLFHSELPDGSGLKVGIVCAEWNNSITQPMLDAAVALLQRSGVNTHNIKVKYVPGTFELPLAAQQMAKHLEINGVICIGCVVQGETRHFDFICQAAASGIMEVGLKFNKPVIFGVLTTYNLEQAKDRAGGKHGNKGEEAAYSLLKMLS